MCSENKSTSSAYFDVPATNLILRSTIMRASQGFCVARQRDHLFQENKINCGGQFERTRNVSIIKGNFQEPF